MITAHKTDVGASMQARSMLEGFSFEIVGFSVGNGGCDSNGNPITVDRRATELPSIIYGPVYNVTPSLNSTTSILVKCVLRAGEMVGVSYSNIGLIARVSSGPDEGSEFLYAIANFAESYRSQGVLTFNVRLYN